LSVDPFSLHLPLSTNIPMKNSHFLQIHFLTHFPASLLNRDDVGLAKRIPLGGATRTRISSQCLKRHWRTANDRWSLSSLDIEMSVRSRYIFSDRIAPRLQGSMSDDMIIAVLQEIRDKLLGKSEKSEKKKRNQEGSEDTLEKFRNKLKTEQVIVLGNAEIDYIVQVAQEIAQLVKTPDSIKQVVKQWFTKKKKENFQSLKHAAGLDAAFFGRMVTADILARGDAAIHVAHAFTVHREFTETDYFSAVDDLEREEGALGSGHIGHTELTSGLFYGYVVIDVPLLIKNLGGDEVLAQKAIEHFVHLVATVSPGAKRGSTAPYARACLLLTERGSSQPRSLSDAFLKPVTPDAKQSIVENAVDALKVHLHRLDTMYGCEEERAYASYYPVNGLPNAQDVRTLDALASWASEIVQSTTPVTA
jgi:CRISPR system Cascade subunit CasC